MDRNSENRQRTTFGAKKVSVWHIAYIIVICLIVNIFLLCVIPGRINDDAYHNFSFAATITSIVLAVVSIVYSIQSGLVSFNRMDGIRDIEHRIGRELDRFTNLENSIKAAVKEGISPLETSMGDIKQMQGDIQKAQDELSNNWKSLMQNGSAINKENGSESTEVVPDFSRNRDIPQIFSIILYTCSQSQKYQKDIPFHILGKFFGTRSYYCEGVIKSLSIFAPDKLQIGIGTKSNRMVVTLYDEASLGTPEWLQNQVKEGKNKKLGKDIITEIDEYFSEVSNADNKECSV